MGFLEINSDLHEIKQHGDNLFPYKIYRGIIPEYQYSYPHHWHEEMEIIYVISGTGVATVNYITYELHIGDILIIRPNDIHSLSQHNNDSWEYFNILFKLTLLEDKLSNNSYFNYYKPLIDHTKKLPTIIKSNTPLSDKLAPNIKDLIINRKSNITDNELLIKAKLFTIMYYLQDYLAQDKKSISTESSDSKLKEILLYISKNYSSLISIDKIAKECCYSKSYFMKFFKKQTGYSFIHYLNNYRLEIATKLLSDNTDTITNIAISVGFENVPYFVRSFKQRYNMSPREFRKIKRNN